VLAAVVLEKCAAGPSGSAASCELARFDGAELALSTHRSGNKFRLVPAGCGSAAGYGAGEHPLGNNG